MSAELEFQRRVAALSNPQLEYMRHLIAQGSPLEAALHLAEEGVPVSRRKVAPQPERRVPPSPPVQPSKTAASGGRRLSRSQRKAMRARGLL